MKDLLKSLDIENYELVKKRPRLVIAFDLDDVLANTLETLISKWNLITGNNKTINDCKNWDLKIDFDESIFEIFKEENFFRNLKPLENAVKTINELISNDHYEVYIVSACGSVREYGEKYEWIQEHIPNFKMSKFINCSEKDIIRADVIIDDNVETLIKCEPYMSVVAKSMPHNEYFNTIRINDISEIISIVEELYRQKY